MKVLATAPGKIIVLGEYAVLEGAPALAIAANRLVRVGLEPAPDTVCRVSAPGYPVDSREFVLRGGEFAWREHGRREGGFELLQVVMEHLFPHIGSNTLAERGFRVELDSRSFYDAARGGSPSKLGLGSSAALVVALGVALRKFAGLPDLPREQWLPVLVDAHRALQSGRGSGIDVAASLFGGVIVYQRRDGAGAATPAAMPSGLRYRFIWSGESASTPGLLRSLALWRQENVNKYKDLMIKMRRISTAAVAAAEADDGARFVEAVSEYAGRLRKLGELAGIDIYSAPHRKLAALAIDNGLVYKPCGAGGGDLGVVMSAGGRSLDRFVTQASSSGCPPVDISIHPEGVRTIGSF